MDVHLRKKRNPRNSLNRSLPPNIPPKGQHQHQHTLLPNLHPNIRTNRPLRQRLLPPHPDPNPLCKNQMARKHPPQKTQHSANPAKSLATRPPRFKSPLNPQTTLSHIPRPNPQHHLQHINLPEPQFPHNNIHVSAQPSRLGPGHSSARNQTGTTGDVDGSSLN